eukprot:TRINITY_DN7313_c0_g1_i2.p1 TRINITY_DN7313_c0_g1~~TRINITY_DN7313_c0_g1_i2.p1  ORF type:complete len:180 (+),score=48.09 TRINITY_DN7313_c0_g1_i2:236-775(+)
MASDEPSKGSAQDRLPFAGFDWTDFWASDDYYTTTYEAPLATEQEIAQVEDKLGYKLPESYRYMLKHVKNGGSPKKKNLIDHEDDSVFTIEAFFGVTNKQAALPQSHELMIREWGYPSIGVYFGDCPSAGHDMMALDYRECGPEGEPKVVCVAQELDYAITTLADTFEAYIRELTDKEE